MTVKDVSMDEWNRSKGKIQSTYFEAPQKQILVEKLDDKIIRIEIDSDKCCEYSKLAPGCEVYRLCTLESTKVYGGKEKVKLEHPACPARIYAQLYKDCPIRNSLRGGG